jgi:hypothetical protein
MATGTMAELIRAYLRTMSTSLTQKEGFFAREVHRACRQYLIFAIMKGHDIKDSQARHCQHSQSNRPRGQVDHP